MTVSNKLSKYKPDLLEIQVVSLERDGTEPACEHAFFKER
jgi:hypothetical protein